MENPSGSWKPEGSMHFDFTDRIDFIVIGDIKEVCGAELYICGNSAENCEYKKNYYRNT